MLHSGSLFCATSKLKSFQRALNCRRNFISKLQMYVTNKTRSTLGLIIRNYHSYCPRRVITRVITLRIINKGTLASFLRRGWREGYLLILLTHASIKFDLVIKVSFVSGFIISFYNHIAKGNYVANVSIIFNKILSCLANLPICMWRLWADLRQVKKRAIRSLKAGKLINQRRDSLSQSIHYEVQEVISPGRGLMGVFRVTYGSR